MQKLIECQTFFGETIELPVERFYFRPAGYAIILQNNHILLLDVPKTGKVCLPGGGIHHGETIPQGLRREMREETGLEITIKQQIAFREDFFYYEPADEAFQNLAFFFDCDPAGGTLHTPNQVQDEEATTPHWHPIPNLQPHHFQAFGAFILQLIPNLTINQFNN